MDLGEQVTVQKVSEILSMPLDEALVAWNEYVACPILGTGGAIRCYSFPRVVLKEGPTLSIQCGEHLYCEPRNDKGPYTKAEVGAYSELPEVFKEYDGGEPSSTRGLRVYGYVPIYLLKWFIEAKGGIDVTESIVLWERHNL